MQFFAEYWQEKTRGAEGWQGVGRKRKEREETRTEGIATAMISIWFRV